MVDYNSIIDKILEKEGGYVHDPDDRGGETNFGVTKTTARHYGYEGEMKNLPESFARTIYFSQYISGPNFLQICEVDPHLGEIVVVFGVHSGPNRAGKYLQRLLNILNNNEHWFSDLKVDGRVGMQTISALKEFINLRGLSGRKILAEAYKGLIINFYIELAERDTSQEKYTYGWLKRVVYG